MKAIDPEYGKKLIEIVRTSVTYNTNSKDIALDDISFTLYQGEHLSIRGNNGAGKSTFLRLMRGEQWIDARKIYTNDAGISSGIYWFHEDGSFDNSALSGRSMVALIAPKQQENILSQAFEITGEELIYGGLTDSIYVLSKPEGEEKKAIEDLAHSLDCTHLLKEKVATLSQGQLRILLVIRALISKPRILLLDEVMDGLDQSARHSLENVLLKIASTITIIFSTHRQEILPDWVSREIYMQDGKIICDSRNFECQEYEEKKSTTDISQLSSAYTEESGAEINIINANVYIDSHLILKNISWKIAKGEQWALYGENGSGKSTLMRLIAGDEYPAFGGSITRKLKNIETKELGLIKSSIRLVSDLQQATYAYDLSAEEFVLTGIDNSIGLYKEISHDDHLAATSALDLLEVAHLAKRSIRACSTGEMRRLMLARAFIGTPDLLLLDEPFSGLDPNTRKNINIILEELSSKGIQIIYVSHYKDDIPKFIKNRIKLENGAIKE